MSSTTHTVRVDTTQASATTAGTTRTDSSQAAHAMNILREGVPQRPPRTVSSERAEEHVLPSGPIGTSTFSANPYLIGIIILGIAILVMMFFRSRRTAKRADIVAKRKMQALRDKEHDIDLPPEPEWTVKDLNTGGKIHLSLPKGLEEDYTVTGRDRIDLPDGRIEYDLTMTGIDPDYPSHIHWWSEGSYVHAWLLEETDYSLGRLEIDQGALHEMKASGEGTVRYRDTVFSLHSAGLCARYVACRRPAHEFYRWDFRNEEGSRMVRIQIEEDNIQILAGEELWLRDLSITIPKSIGDEPPKTNDSGDSPPSTISEDTQ